MAESNSSMSKDYGEEMASTIDSEIEKMVHGACEEVKQILIQKRDVLDKLVYDTQLRKHARRYLPYNLA